MHTYFQNDSHLPEAYAVNCFLILYSFPVLQLWEKLQDSGRQHDEK